MRIAIREQLAALVLFLVLLSLAIVSIPTWSYVHGFVIDIESSSLALSASLKAAQLSSQIELIQSACNQITSRMLVQSALRRFYSEGNASDANWATATTDIRSALHHGDLLQIRLYSRNETGGGPGGLLNVTGDDIPDIMLPDYGGGDRKVKLGDPDGGYPPMLYPNITYHDAPSISSSNNSGAQQPVARPFPEVRIDSSINGLILGPLAVNESYALLSLTVPIRQNNDSRIVLGYLTTVADASSLLRIASSYEGLGASGSTLIIGPTTGWNRFSKYNLPTNATYDARGNFTNVDAHFVFPPTPRAGVPDRHASRSMSSSSSGYHDKPFMISQYDAALRAFTARNPVLNNASSNLATSNEQGVGVAVGCARPQTSLVNWAVVVEQDLSEALAPINTLTHIILACVFGTVGLILVIIFPCAHLSVMPIRRLKAATAKAGFEDQEEREQSPDDEGAQGDDCSLRHLEPSLVTGQDEAAAAKSKSALVVAHLKRRFLCEEDKIDTLSTKEADADQQGQHRRFRIPGKVPPPCRARPTFITDELTELTGTYNAMVEELRAQYTSLEEKVAVRTRELEASKRAAEAANESKTLFIANISHELKTPLNGIMGMAAVCMEETDVGRIRSSLKVLFESGDLLLHLLEDLLSFSKNQIGGQLTLEEKEFRLGNVQAQVAAIFEKQVREAAIDFSVSLLGNGPDQMSSGRQSANEAADAENGAAPLKDLCFWGDQHRILQVLINLVSNSLKFTPAGGKVAVRVRCVEEVVGPDRRLVAISNNESRASSFSRTSRNSSAGGGGGGGRFGRMKRKSSRQGPNSDVMARDRSPTPPPPNASRPYMFEFEVEDTGPGIPASMHDTVFEPFVQGDLGLSRRFGGTGLGLSICKQLATLMGGSILLRSQVGLGTTFTVRIPLRYVGQRSSISMPSDVSLAVAAAAEEELRTETRADDSAGADLQAAVAAAAAAATAAVATAAVATVTEDPAMQANEEAKAIVMEQQPRLVGLSQPFFSATPRPGESQPSPPIHQPQPLPQQVKPQQQVQQMPPAPLATPPPSSAEDQMKVVEAAAASKASRSGGRERLRVLVADDNSTNVRVVTQMLRFEDVYDVTIARDGQEAYDLVRETMSKSNKSGEDGAAADDDDEKATTPPPFDLIFMDVQMPNVDGLQSTRLIRKAGYSAPIVALTAFSEESNVRECMASGMDEFLSKPIRRPALKKVLRKYASIPEESSETAAPTTTQSSEATLTNGDD